ncbi:4-hydroxy-3-methylbut-2-enyl diphosphate reductase [bacterium]|nr:4-hydroxy-3-methylbut-2-enyl diphosphate reductase [bacterium]NCQ55428.1 4-hydroxy-3-methylbut-2-enyl diphosphate reductase [Candidatus Parcubacteria bacterium]NCS67790.1 4-hydroxy-3-methylbut-2-enyl diphosphate reductase [Candidatus Peregrinibacteria bacterium]NCS96396.1 4-hydroxy-3-methylbut-2-enyl diphosphate reductase [bacterium]
MIETLYLAQPRGFCAGVERAIAIVDLALKKYDRPVWVNHEIVHNRSVVESFRSRGVIFSDDVEAIPEDAVFILSAHGTAPGFRKKVEARGIQIIDATCPLVTKVHWEAQKFHTDGYKIFYIGQAEHQESIGVMDVAPMTLIENEADILDLDFDETEKIVVLSQTTLSVDDTKRLSDLLKYKIPHLREPGDLCYATQNRQDAVKVLSQTCDYIIVIGSENSSNSNKMVVTANKNGVDSQLFDTAEEIPNNIFDHKSVGLTSGASVPDSLVMPVIEKAKAINPNLKVEIVLTKDESGLSFPLPLELRT